ncbi:beta-amyrin 11-oxidase-like isoform X2 [Vigna unguiculata]|uniref:beta-amyrin 11-oxidase-like isoform X2 n=1 Tax=Vigna unguiculata TaxID=3917 RepID=UPI0010169BB4|nr:beta-amyrin 11-oxidase-like isoform X2 [Vigna unguiculata]
MELSWVWMIVATFLACYIFVKKIVRKSNEWYYDMKLGNKHGLLPPGDMGWPLIGNIIPFIKDFNSGHPDSFINNLHSKYGESGIYKTHLIGKPSIIICTPEMCKRVLNDDENFKHGYPKSTTELLRNKPLINTCNAEHKGLRELVSSGILGHKVLAMNLELVEKIVINSLEELSRMKQPIQVFKEMEKVSFEVIVHILMGSYTHSNIGKLRELFHQFSKCNPIYSLPINFPGFAFHQGLKVRKKLLIVIESIVGERRSTMKMVNNGENKKDLIELILEAKWENDEELKDKDVADMLLMLLFAGHETTAMAFTSSILYLTRHPQVFAKAKVIDEMLRRTNIAFSLFREATKDVNINGYIIPKGWRVLVWLRAIHMNPKYYPNPEEFNPSRWDENNVRAATFLPFGAGSRLCPGNNIFKYEISIFLHYFLLNYKLEETSPEGPEAVFPFSQPKDLAKLIKLSK